MEPLKAFEVKSLELSGFKQYSDRQYFRFGHLTQITGGNYQGKSTFADAIAFAITGLSFFGEHRVDWMYCDRMSKRNIQVTMTFSDEDGRSHVLVRRRVADKMSLTLDERMVTQLEVSILFGEPDLFLAIFNPLYTIEVLEAKEHAGRKLIERYVRSIEKEAVLERMGAQGLLLDGMSLISPEGDLKQLRAEIREQEESQVYFEGQVDLMAAQERTRRDRKRDLSILLQQAEDELKSLEEKRTQGGESTDQEMAAAMLRSQYEELSEEDPPVPDDRELQAGIQESMAAIAAVEAARFTFEGEEALATATAERKELYAWHGKECEHRKAICVGSSCPVCHQQITAQNVQEVCAAADAVLAGIVTDGLAKKEEIDTLLKNKETAQAAFEQERKKQVQSLGETLAKQRVELAEASERYTAFLHRRAEELKQLEGAIQAVDLARERGSLTEDEFSRWDGLRAQRALCLDELAKLEPSTALSEQEVDPQRGLNYAVEQLEEKKKLEEAIMRYIAVKNSLLAEQLQMNRVTISLFEVVKKSGEAKDTFKFEYEGRCYAALSQSQRMRAGLELSNLMSRLSGRSFPVFVDNAESIESIDNVELSGQVFVATMVANTPLAVIDMDEVRPCLEQQASAA